MIVAAFFLTVIPASAASANVTLYTNQTTAFSSIIQGKKATFNASNSSSSLHKVYATAQEKSGLIFADNSQKLMSPGTSVSNVNTQEFLSSREWRLELNPQGLGYTNCSASGTIFN